MNVAVVAWFQKTTAAQETTIAAQGAASGSVGFSELLSGFIGALIVFGLQFVRDEWRRRRERIALITLIHLEVMQNQLVFEDIGDADPVATGDLALLRDDAWRENRARITQLEDEFWVEYLGMYYTSIGTLVNTNRLARETHSDDAPHGIEEIFAAARDNSGPVARYVCERQTGAVRVWSNGLLVEVARWKPVENVEARWKQQASWLRRLLHWLS